MQNIDEVMSLEVNEHSRQFTMKKVLTLRLQADDIIRAKNDISSDIAKMEEELKQIPIQLKQRQDFLENNIITLKLRLNEINRHIEQAQAWTKQEVTPITQDEIAQEIANSKAASQIVNGGNDGEVREMPTSN